MHWKFMHWKFLPPVISNGLSLGCCSGLGEASPERNNHEITEKLVYNINCGTRKLKEFYQLVVNKKLNLHDKMLALVNK